MKRQVLMLCLMAPALFFAACGGSDKKEKKADVALSTEMQDFMLNFNGRSASVRIALDDFGKPGLDRKDMDLYDLNKPKVLESNGNCYLMQFESGVTKRKYNICWDGGKIASVEDKGMD
jgi:hypothetical protein